MLNSLQGLRAVAAYMVVAAHCLATLNFTDHTIPHFRAGAAGVDLFFVISGFIMVYVAGARGTPAAFLFNRIARIVPLYWATTLATLAVFLFRHWMFPHIVLSWQYILGSFAFVPMLSATGEFVPIVPVGWTLIWEMMFYVLFAISMFAAGRLRLVILLCLMVGIFLIGLAAPADWSLSYYGSPIIFEFAAGCLIAKAMQEPKIVEQLKRLPHWGLMGLGAALIVASFLVYDVNDWVRPIFWGAPGALMVIGAVLRDLKQPATTPKTSGGFLKALGDASYSAYLLHSFVNAVVIVFIPRLLGMSYPVAALCIALTFAGTMVLSLLSYRFLEIPARDMVRRLLLPRRPVRAETT